ncbi:MAG TPA: helix-turn-helix transcriptional regulator [Thermoanaerobaculia bacterium]|nr:helix-turn-helix transcriptional regulator [Thermoanaerobaculia bacterium]
MSWRAHPEDLRLLVRFLRSLRDWSQQELAAAAGLDPSSIARYETGHTVPKPKALERLTAAAGVPASLAEACLLPAIGAARAAAASAGAAEPAELETVAAELEQTLAGTRRSAAAAFLASLGEPGEPAEPWERSGPPAEEDRALAAELWQVLAPLAPGERRLLVEKSREYQTWALAERLCHESAEAASDDAGRAVELAELALRVAVLAPGERLWRLRLQGYCLGFLANARRVRNDERRAEEASARARRRWQEGQAGDPSGLLAEWRLLDLEASLRRSQRRFAEALDLSDRALAAAPRSAAARILVNKAVAFDHLGEAERAIATLRQAAPLVDGRREPRLVFALRFNLATNLCHLDRYSEAALLLPEVRQMAEALRKELDLVRVAWLEGRIAAGLGRPAAALAAFARVRGELLARGMAYDAALVTLELAALHAAAGRTAEVKELAHQTAQVFRAKGIHREARAALQLFRQAADQEALTAELARQLVAYFYRARHDPELAFAAVA